MKKALISLLLSGSIIGGLTIGMYVDKTNFCQKYDDGRITSWIMENQPTDAYRKANLAGAVRTRRAAKAAMVRTCLSSYEDYGISTVRGTINLPSGIGSSSL